jgi:Flp pilus assembly protein TadD
MRSPLLLLSKSFLLLLVFPAIAPAQNMPNAGMTSLHGAVHDAASHKPLERAIVMVDAEEAGNVEQVLTDGMGKFSVTGLGPAAYIVRVHFPGYEEASERVDLSATSSNFVDFQLRPLPGAKTPPVAPEGPAAKLDARLASVPDKARKEFLKARDLWQEGKDPQGCVDQLNKAIKDYPKFPDAYVLLANAQMQLNNTTEANAALDHAIAIDPKLPDAWLARGMLQNRLKDYAGAEKSLTQGLQLDDRSAEGHFELARTYWALGRWQDADPHAQKAAALMPGMGPVHVLLGNIALRKQDAPGALKEFQEYLKLDPNGPMAPGVQAMVKKIQDALAADANANK